MQLRTLLHDHRSIGAFRRSQLLLVAALIANAFSLFAFRWFATLDGPTHVLRAAVVESSWSTPRYVAEDIAYDVDRLHAGPTELILMLLMKVGPPQFAHTALAVLLLLVLGFAGYALVRSLGARPNAMLLWLLPLSFNYVLVLGFFPFLLALAAAMALSAWWCSRSRLAWSHLAGLAIGLVICSMVHRSGAVLALVLLSGCEAALLRSDRAGANARWAFLPRPLRYAALGSLAIGVAVFAVRMQLFGSVQGPSLAGRSPAADFFSLRALLLLDPQVEWPYLLAFGSLLVASLVLAVIARARSGHVLRPADGLLIAALFFVIASVSIRNRMVDLLFFAERAQVIGLLLVALWLAAQPASRVLTAVALFVVPLHVLRTVHVERKMAQLEPAYQSMMSAGGSCAEGSVVLPIILEPNWLLMHNPAYFAAHHPGIVMTGRDHLNFTTATAPNEALGWYLTHRYGGWEWFGAHVAQHNPPAIDHVLVIGTDPMLRDSIMGRVQPVLDTAYWLTKEDGYCRLYTLKQE